MPVVVGLQLLLLLQLLPPLVEVLMLLPLQPRKRRKIIDKPLVLSDHQMRDYTSIGGGDDGRKERIDDPLSHLRPN